jgi:hypothetical protein
MANKLGLKMTHLGVFHSYGLPPEQPLEQHPNRSQQDMGLAGVGPSTAGAIEFEFVSVVAVVLESIGGTVVPFPEDPEVVVSGVVVSLEALPLCSDVFPLSWPLWSEEVFGEVDEEEVLEWLEDDNVAVSGLPGSDPEVDMDVGAFGPLESEEAEESDPLEEGVEDDEGLGSVFVAPKPGWFESTDDISIVKPILSTIGPDDVGVDPSAHSGLEEDEWVRDELSLEDSPVATGSNWAVVPGLDPDPRKETDETESDRDESFDFPEVVFVEDPDIWLFRASVVPAIDVRSGLVVVLFKSPKLVEFGWTGPVYEKLVKSGCMDRSKVMPSSVFEELGVEWDKVGNPDWLLNSETEVLNILGDDTTNGWAESVAWAKLETVAFKALEDAGMASGEENDVPLIGDDGPFKLEDDEWDGFPDDCSKHREEGDATEFSCACISVGEVETAALLWLPEFSGFWSFHASPGGVRHGVLFESIDCKVGFIDGNRLESTKAWLEFADVDDELVGPSPVKEDRVGFPDRVTCLSEEAEMVAYSVFRPAMDLFKEVSELFKFSNILVEFEESEAVRDRESDICLKGVDSLGGLTVLEDSRSNEATGFVRLTELVEIAFPELSGWGVPCWIGLLWVESIREDEFPAVDEPEFPVTISLLAEVSEATLPRDWGDRTPVLLDFAEVVPGKDEPLPAIRRILSSERETFLVGLETDEPEDDLRIPSEIDDWFRFISAKSGGRRFQDWLVEISEYLSGTVLIEFLDPFAMRLMTDEAGCPKFDDPRSLDFERIGAFSLSPFFEFLGFLGLVPGLLGSEEMFNGKSTIVFPDEVATITGSVEGLKSLELGLPEHPDSSDFEWGIFEDPAVIWLAMSETTILLKGRLVRSTDLKGVELVKKDDESLRIGLVLPEWASDFAPTLLDRALVSGVVRSFSDSEASGSELESSVSDLESSVSDSEAWRLRVGKRDFRKFRGFLGRSGLNWTVAVFLKTYSNP